MPRLPHSDFPATVYQEAVLHDQWTPRYDLENEDDEYDVYLFWPSTKQCLLLPEHVAQDSSYELASASLYSPRHQLDDELCTDSSSPPTSPTYTFVSDYVLPESHPTSGMSLAGYSRLFTAGLTARSRQITRQLDNAYLSLRRVFNWASRLIQ